MAVVTHRWSLLTVLFGLAAYFSFAADVAKGQAVNSVSDQTEQCIRNIKQAVQAPLSDPPEFASIGDLTKWLDKRLPEQIRARFVVAGRNVSRSLKDWEQHNMIHGAFWNLQALKEILIAQAPAFRGIADCKMEDELGAGYEILQDQIFIALDLGNKPIAAMKQLGVSDPYYAKMAIMYGVILDFAKVAWKDEQIAQVAKFRLEPPES